MSAFSETAPKEEVQVSSPSANVAVFVSPFIRFDITARLAIVEIRNSETGEVQQQYPSPRAVREYQQNLPADSTLRSQGDEDSADSQPRIIGSAEDRAATAAFSNLQGVPTGGKQVVVA